MKKKREKMKNKIKIYMNTQSNKKKIASTISGNYEEENIHTNNLDKDDFFMLDD